MDPAKTKQHDIEDFGLKIVANKLFFTTESLKRAFDVSDQTLANWKKNKKAPLEHSHHSTTRLHLYDFFGTIKWYFEVIDENKAIRSAKNKVKRLDFPQYLQGIGSEDDVVSNDITSLPALELDRLRKVELLIQERIQSGIMKGEYIPIEDFAKGQAEPIMVLLADLRALLSQWPYKLKNLQPDEIEEIIDADIHRSVEYLRGFLQSKEIEADQPTFNDALDTIKELLDSGLTPKEIVALADK